MQCNNNNKISSFVYTFIALLAAKCFCGRQVIKRQAAANAVALLSRVGNMVLEKTICKVFGATDTVRRFATPVSADIGIKIKTTFSLISHNNGLIKELCI